MTSSPSDPRYIEVEGDKPKVEVTTRYFAELRASLKNGLDVQRELGMQVAALMTDRDQLRAENERLRERLQRTKDIADRGAGPDTSPEDALRTISHFIDLTFVRLNNATANSQERTDA